MQAEQKKLLEKFLEGNCSDRELQEVKVLLNKPEAKEFLHQLMEDQAAEVESAYALPKEELEQRAEEWLRKVHRQMPVETGDPLIRNLNRRKWPFMRYAAIWAGLLMVASFTFFQLYPSFDREQESAYVEKTNALGIPVKYTLPDSSSVYLGAGSQLKYPRNFDGDVRKVTLKGEAFFQITRMPSKPFIVFTGEVRTQVLGTSFKVQAFEGKPLTVSVATGKVSVTKTEGDQTRALATLTPGLQVTYNSLTGETISGNVDVHGLLDWKDGDIIFDEQRLETVTSELERRFGVKIVFADESLRDYKVSGSFSAGQSVETDMKILSRIGTFKYHSNTNKSFLIHKPDHMN